MWTMKLFGTDVYHLVAAFLVYSILGWFVESVYMSFCNRKITNRGFAKGPFCPIYGVGAVCCYLIFSPVKGQYLKIYFLGALLATVFEYLVGRGIISLFGELWWDYKEKPFNFQGIICLESTVAWGFYALGIVHILHGWVYALIDSLDMGLGIIIVCVLLAVALVDYCIQLGKAFHVKERYRNFMSRR